MSLTERTETRGTKRKRNKGSARQLTLGAEEEAAARKELESFVDTLVENKKEANLMNTENKTAREQLLDKMMHYRLRKIVSRGYMIVLTMKPKRPKMDVAKFWMDVVIEYKKTHTDNDAVAFKKFAAAYRKRLYDGCVVTREPCISIVAMKPKKTKKKDDDDGKQEAKTKKDKNNDEFKGYVLRLDGISYSDSSDECEDSLDEDDDGGGNDTDARDESSFTKLTVF